MAERLSDEERKIINDNWDTIKKSVSSQTTEIEVKDFKIKIDGANNGRIKLTILKDNKLIDAITVSLNAKIIKFKLYSDKNEEESEKKELIYKSSSILYFIEKYKMKHPIYKKKENENIRDKSVNKDTIDEIFTNPDVNEIIDDHFESYIPDNIFNDYKNKIECYDNYSLKEYSQFFELITNKTGKKIVESEERKKFLDFIENISAQNEKIIIIAGAQKIGITFSILQIVDTNAYIYIDLNTIFKLNRVDKRKYLFIRFINQYRDYEAYYKFMNENLLSLQGFNNILSIIEEIISIIAKNLKNKIIIIDNYDDYLVGNKKLSSDYIDKLYSIIEDKQIKILFIGKGKYICNLLLDYFYNKNKIKNYILFKYIKTLELSTENYIHSFYKEKKMNEIELYYNLRNNNMETTIIDLITMKNIKKIIKKDVLIEFPFQFFQLWLDENNNFKIENQFDDLIDLNNLKLREYLAKLNNNVLIFNKDISSVKGFFFEELVISILMNNKSGLKNLIINSKNIIEVESIYDIKEDISTVSDLIDGPILIIQKTNGQTFDFGIIFNDNNLNYFIGGQIGLNKTNDDLKSYQTKILDAHDNILKNMRKLTGREIKELKFLLILNKEWQESLQKDYDVIYQDIDKYKKKLDLNKSVTKYESDNNDKNIKKLSQFNSKYGIKCCENWNISYLLFSEKDLCFYKDNEKLEFIDINNIKSFKTGFELFCIKEYNLIPYTDLEPILNETEKAKFIQKLREIDSDINDIKIDYKINGKINIMAVTPENYGIISIYNDVKIFTYFDEKINILIIKDGNVAKYQNFSSIKNIKFENNEFLKRYFVELVYENENEEVKGENKNSIMEEGIQIEEEKEQKKYEKEENLSKESKRKRRKEEQKKTVYINHIKYLQNKRERDDNDDKDNNKNKK